MTIAATLLLIVSLILGDALASGAKVQSTVESSTRAQQETRLALESLVRELRTKQAVLDVGPTDPGEFALSFLSSPDAGATVQTVAYRLWDGALTRRVDGGPEVVVLANLKNDVVTPYEPLFTYYDTFGNQVVSSIPASARRVRIKLVVANGDLSPLEIETDVTFRVLA